MQTTEIRETWTALYARLSLDDGNVGESMSIQSQKAILTRKAEELGIYNYRFYVDDGYYEFQPSVLSTDDSGHRSRKSYLCDHKRPFKIRQELSGERCLYRGIFPKTSGTVYRRE